jgi:hypothetical protein
VARQAINTGHAESTGMRRWQQQLPSPHDAADEHSERQPVRK